MPRPRETHLSKTQEERRYYWRTTIRPPGPTIEDTTSDIDTTDHSDSADQQRIGPVTTKKSISPFVQFLKERAFEIIIILILIPLFSWILSQTYKLNREVGEFKSTQTGLSDKIEVLSSDVKSLDQRIDSLFDSNLRKTNPTNKK